MNPLVERMLWLEEYRCRRCQRLFYVESGDRSSMELEFGCPYGCDDNGQHVCSLSGAIKEATEAPAKDEKTSDEIRDYRMILNFCPEEFELSMGRRPKSQAEFDQWAALAEKGLFNGHIDWDILYDCTCDAMTNYGGDKK
jgi:hypothetical protein